MAKSKTKSGLARIIAGMFAAGTVLLLAAPHATHLPYPISPNPQAGSQPDQQAGTGTVIADDETATSPPYQIAYEPPAEEPQSNYIAKKPASKATRTVVIDDVEYPLITYKLLLSPNDPKGSQWWVGNTRLDQTWDIPQGTDPTVVAVIDSGFALKHEEFTDRWYVNPGESGVATSEGASLLNCTDKGAALNANCNLVDDDNDGTVDEETGSATYQNASRLNCTAQLKPLTKDCNRLDDDNNGYIDDVTGWDFINGDNSVQAGELNPAGPGTTHGTMTTGVLAATGNNSKGIAGVDWGATIMPIQALDDDSYGDTLSVGRAIFYAVRQGADVINLSLGGESPDPYVQRAIRAATVAGVIVVAAAGNDGCDCMLYPANYPEVVAVGALNTSSQRASFSSWGSNLDIMAPGTNMNTTTWSNGNATGNYANNVAGTSFAAPVVAGLLARLRSAHPNATPLQLIAALTENTNRLTLPATNPRDSRLGFGALDMFKASQRLTTPYSPDQLYALTPISHGNHLDPLSPIDITSNASIHQCADGTIPGTAVYELTKGTDNFFTVSAAEASKAVDLGYASSVYSYACVQQAHDTPGMLRGLDIFAEFKNINKKLY